MGLNCWVAMVDWTLNLFQKLAKNLSCPHQVVCHEFKQETHIYLNLESASRSLISVWFDLFSVLFYLFIERILKKMRLVWYLSVESPLFGWSYPSENRPYLFLPTTFQKNTKYARKLLIRRSVKSEYQ